MNYSFKVIAIIITLAAIALLGGGTAGFFIGRNHPKPVQLENTDWIIHEGGTIYGLGCIKELQLVTCKDSTGTVILEKMVITTTDTPTKVITYHFN